MSGTGGTATARPGAPGPARGVADRRAREAAVGTLVAAALALGVAQLVPPTVCAVVLALLVLVGLVVPARRPDLVANSAHRSAAAFSLVLAVIGLSAVSAPGGLGSGVLGGSGTSGGLAAAARELALPTAVPVGLLTSLAAGALLAVSLELVDRRGVQSALTLSVAVLGLTSVAAPGQKLILPFAIGWPAALFALARLAGSPGDDERVVRVTEAPGPVTRWQVVPVLVALGSAGTVLGVLVLSGVSTLAARSGGWDTGDAQPGADTRSTSDYLGGQMDLTARGSLDDDPLAQVPADSPRLWRAGTLDTYDGRGWTATDDPAGPPELTAERAGVLALRYPAATGEPAAPGGRLGGQREDEVRPLRRGVTQVLSPGRLVTVGAATFAAGGSAVVSAGDRVTVVGTAPKSYFVRSQPLPAAADPLAAAALGPVPGPSAAGDDLADGRYLALPAELPDRVRELAGRLAGPAPSRLLAVRAIERELATRVRYDLDSPVPSPGVDAVDDVLFVSHEGFCEQFASAEVVMLRAVGIPARMAVGFAASAPTDSGERPLRRSDAHAWVEVWFPTVGWVTSDPTPPGAVPTSWFDRASAWLTRALRTAGAHWALVLSVVAATVVAGAGVVLVIVRLRRPEPPLPAVDPDLAAAFVRLQADLEAVGAGRDPTETVGMLARRLPADLRAPLSVLERALYAPTPPTREECLGAAHALDGRGT